MLIRFFNYDQTTHSVDEADLMRGSLPSPDKSLFTIPRIMRRNDRC
jgi:hypothetical protein